MSINYKEKYLKYKFLYLKYKNLIGGSLNHEERKESFRKVKENKFMDSIPDTITNEDIYEGHKNIKIGDLSVYVKIVKGEMDSDDIEIINSMTYSNLVETNICPHFPFYYGYYTKNGYTFIVYENCDGTLTSVKSSPEEFDSYLCQMMIAEYTLLGINKPLADRHPGNRMYINILKDSYLYYKYKDLSIYIKTMGKLWIEIDFDMMGMPMESSEYEKQYPDLIQKYFQNWLLERLKKIAQKYKDLIIIIKDGEKTDEMDGKKIFNSEPYTIFSPSKTD